MTTQYQVTWVIDIEADSPTEAARQALEIQQDPESIATVFEVSGGGSTVLVDLEPGIATL